MRYVLYLIVGLVLCSCQKEDILLDKRVLLENFYTIQDDPNDSIQHRRYEMYKTYRVPVFFNDTIGKTFLKVNGSNDSVFTWETIDYNWNYTGVRGKDYEYFYMSDPNKQSLMLDVVESYLKKASKTLYPYCIFLVDSAYASGKNSLDTYGTMVRKGNKAYQSMSYMLGFRSMLLAGFMEGGRDSLASIIIKSQIRQKIGNFEKKLLPFNLTSKTEWYNKIWTVNLKAPTIKVENIDYDFAVGYVTSDTYRSMFPPRPTTQEQRTAIEQEVRKFIGGFGFVGPNSMNSPENTSADVNAFLDEMLRRGPEKFTELWGAYPLVMKKYEILYDIVVNDMEIEL